MPILKISTIVIKNLELYKMFFQFQQSVFVSNLKKLGHNYSVKKRRKNLKIFDYFEKLQDWPKRIILLRYIEQNQRVSKSKNFHFTTLNVQKIFSILICTHNIFSSSVSQNINFTNFNFWKTPSALKVFKLSYSEIFNFLESCFLVVRHISINPMDTRMPAILSTSRQNSHIQHLFTFRTFNL